MKKTVLLTAALLGLSSLPALAVPVAANASFGFIPLGDVHINNEPQNVASATTVFLPGSNIVNTLVASYLGNPNNFCNIGDCGFNGGPAGSMLVVGQTVSLPATLDATFAILPTITFSGGTTPGFRYTFTATSGFKLTSAPNNLELDYIGTFHDAGGDYLDGAASVSFAFTQTGGPTGTINYSGVFATPPAFQGAPEPTSLVLLGSALVGLGMIGRKRFAR